MLDWNTIITIASIGTLFVYSKPTIMLRRYLGFKEEEFDTYSKIKQFFFELITCNWCSTFWLAAYTIDLPTMAVAAILANAIEKWIILK